MTWFVSYKKIYLRNQQNLTQFRLQANDTQKK